jgi:hypothetical protein
MSDYQASDLIDAMSALGRAARKSRRAACGSTPPVKSTPQCLYFTNGYRCTNKAIQEISHGFVMPYCDGHHKEMRKEWRFCLATQKDNTNDCSRWHPWSGNANDCNKCAKHGGEDYLFGSHAEWEATPWTEASDVLVAVTDAPTINGGVIVVSQPPSVPPSGPEPIQKYHGEDAFALHCFLLEKLSEIPGVVIESIGVHGAIDVSVLDAHVVIHPNSASDALFYFSDGSDHPMLAVLVRQALESAVQPGAILEGRKVEKLE